MHFATVKPDDRVNYMGNAMGTRLGDGHGGDGELVYVYRRLGTARATRTAWRVASNRIDSGQPREQTMIDVAFVLFTIVFFVVSLAYVRGCDRL